MQMASSMAKMRLGSLCFLLFILYSSLIFVYIYSSVSRLWLRRLFFLLFAPFLFAEVVGRVSVCVFQHAFVAGAAFADGVACAEWAAAVLVAGA